MGARLSWDLGRPPALDGCGRRASRDQGGYWGKRGPELLGYREAGQQMVFGASPAKGSRRY